MQVSHIFSSKHIPRVVKQVMKTVQINQMLNKKWEFIFGKLAQDLSLLFYKQNIIYLGCNNPLWVTEIDYYKLEIIKKMNYVLNKKTTVKGLKIRYIQNKTVKKKEPTLPPSLMSKSLIEKIKEKEKSHLKKNQKLCFKCQKVYIPNTKIKCTFCDNDEINK
tara:strand:+ start:432 stop:917 length:486 start_codon:yes stop_codon:yes gene_type:complete